MKSKILISVCLFAGVLSMNGQAIYQVSKDNVKSSGVTSSLVAPSVSTPEPALRQPTTMISSGSSYSSQIYAIGAQSASGDYNQVSMRRGNGIGGGGVTPGDPGQQGNESPIGSGMGFMMMIAMLFGGYKAFRNRLRNTKK